ncbi:hypothetical protein Hanom_Chr06g00572591 [Helianthus anomalus]
MGLHLAFSVIYSSYSYFFGLCFVFCSFCMVKGWKANLACVLAWSSTGVRRGGHKAALDMGPYITRLARILKAFDIKQIF